MHVLAVNPQCIYVLQYLLHLIVSQDIDVRGKNTFNTNNYLTHYSIVRKMFKACDNLE